MNAYDAKTRLDWPRKGFGADLLAHPAPGRANQRTPAVLAAPAQDLAGISQARLNDTTETFSRRLGEKTRGASYASSVECYRRTESRLERVFVVGALLALAFMLVASVWVSK